MPTLIAFAATTDHRVQSDNQAPVDGPYSDAIEGIGTATLTDDTATATEKVGQFGVVGSGSGFSIWEYFLSFDTSAVGASPVVSASLALVPFGLQGPSREYQARMAPWSGGTGDWIPGSQLASKRLVAKLASSAMTGGVYASFTDVGLSDYLERTGTTFVVLVQEDQVSQTPPPDLGNIEESVVFRSADDTGTTSDPKITVVYGVTVMSVGAAGSATSGDLTLAYPTVASGQRLIAVISAADNVASTRAGWTLKQGTNNGTGLRTEIWYKDAASDGTESGNLTWTRTSGLTSEGRMFAIAGAVVVGDPIEAAAASANASSATVTFPSLTTLTDAALVFATVSAAGVATSASYSGTNPTFFEESDDSTDPRPQFVASTAVGLASAGTSISITMPATAQTGDLAVVAITVKSATLTATRAGWTGITGSPFGDAASPASRTFILTHTVGAGEPNTSLSFTLSGSVKAAGVMSIWRNADTTTPRNTSAGQVNASGTSSVAPTITPTAANTVAIYFTGPSTGETLTTQPTGYQQPATNFTVAATGGSGATRCGVGFGYSLYPTSGAATGTKTGTISAATTSAGVHLAIAALNPTSNPVSMAVADDVATAAGSITGRTATLSTALVNTGVLFALKPNTPTIRDRVYISRAAVQRAASW